MEVWKESERLGDLAEAEEGEEEKVGEAAVWPPTAPPLPSDQAAQLSFPQEDLRASQGVQWQL